MTATKKYERRVVRPFADISEADIPLNVVRLFVDGEEFESGNVELPDFTLKSAEFALQLPSRDDLIKHVGKTQLPYVDCGLVVIATGKSIRGNAILLKEYLESGSWPNEITIPRLDDDLILGDIRGFRLTVAVVLLNDLVPEPLKPSIAGTWIARRDFHIKPESQYLSFSPEKLSDAMKARYGIPAKALRYIRVEGILNADDLSDAVSVYVDPDILDRLKAQEDQPFSLQFQTDLALLTHEAVAGSILRELAEVTESSDPSLGDLENYEASMMYLDRLAGKLRLEVSELFEIIKNDQSRFRAHLETLFDARKATEIVLKGL